MTVNDLSQRERENAADTRAGSWRLLRDGENKFRQKQLENQMKIG